MQFNEAMDDSQNPCEGLGMKLGKWLDDRLKSGQSETASIGTQVQCGKPNTATAMGHQTKELFLFSCSGPSITPLILLPLLLGPWTSWMLLALPQ